jgi:hypothetical protein
MNTSEIWTQLHRLFSCHNVHFDVLPADGLDTVRSGRKPSYLIVNSDDSSKPGQHWVALVITDSIYFMCSYGVRMESYGHHFSDLIRRLQKRVVQKIGMVLQQDGSDVCGHYALYFLYCKFKKLNFYSKFSVNRRENDLMVKSFISKYKNCTNVKTKSNVQICCCK